MLRVQTIFTGVAGSPYYNSLYFQGGSLVDAQSVHDRVADFWLALGSVLSQDLSAQVQGDVEALDPNTGQVVGVFGITPRVIIGGDSGQPLPFFTQGLVQLRTGVWVNGREIRGRMFIPSPTENAQTTGQPSGAYRNTIQDELDDLIGGTPTQLGVYSRTHRQLEYVSAATTWTQWGSLRSRRD